MTDNRNPEKSFFIETAFQFEFLSKWRQTTLDWILCGIFVFTTPVLILGIINAIQDYHQGYSFAQAAGLITLYIGVYICTALITFVKRIGYYFRTGSLFFLLACVGVVDLLSGGLSSDGFLFIFAAVALAAIFFNLKNTIVVLLIGLGVIVVVAGLLISGSLVIKPELQTNSANLASWVVRGFVFILLSTAIVLSSSYLVRSLEQSLFSTKKQADHLSILNDIALDVIAHKNMEELLQAVVVRAANLMGTNGGALYLVSDDGEKLVMAGVCVQGRDYVYTSLERGEGVAGRVFASGQPMVIREYAKWDGQSPTYPPGIWGSIIQVPILLADKVIGVLGCYTIVGQLRDFTQEDVLRLEGLARHVAIAIDNVKLIEATRQAESRLDTIVQSAPSAIISVDQQQRIIMFNKAAEKVFSCSPDDVIGKHINILIPERFHHTHIDYMKTFLHAKPGLNSILISRELVGRRLSNEEFPVEVSISRVKVGDDKFIMTAIMQDITVRKRTQDALRESEAHSRILLEFAKDLELSQTYQDVLLGAHGIVRKTIGYTNTWFYVISDDKKQGRLLGAVGNKAEMIANLLPVIPITGDQYVEEIASGLKPAVVEDARTSPYVNEEIVSRLGNRSIVNIPVVLLGRQFGTLGMGTFDDEGVLVPTQVQLDFLSTMAGHIAVSVDRITQASERARAEAELTRRHQIQGIVNKLLQLALENVSLNEKLEKVLAVILSTPWLPTLPKGAIFLVDKASGDLVLKVQRNLDESLKTACARVRPGQCLCGRAAQSGEVQFATNVDLHHEIHYDGMESHGHYNIPIRHGNTSKGVLALYLAEGHTRNENEIEFLTAVGNAIAGLIDRAEAQESIERANAELILSYDTTLEGWSKALDLRDKETGDHTARVAELTMKLARFIGVPDDELAHIWRGALLHDIGKMGVPDATLKKTGELTATEWKIMQRHPQNAYDMLSSIPFLRKALDIPYCHHEKWDGSGYPRGLKGEQIPLAARIFSLVDVWDALKADRPYRGAWQESKILEYLQEQSGKHFDPQIVAAFFEMLSQ